jgi:2',3'-cyclic-nucleotide 2'-phosphodiesterase (5'-nucleotidase family)
MNPDRLAQLPNQEQAKGLDVIPPETALNRLLSEVRGKADLVILLSRFDVNGTIALVKATKGVDVAISSGGDEIYFAKEPENTVILQTGSLGATLGLLKITLDEKRALSVSERRHVRLDRSVPGNEEVARLVEEFKKVQKEKAADLAKKEVEKIQEGLKLSPKEFMERLQKEQQSPQYR